MDEHQNNIVIYGKQNEPKSSAPTVKHLDPVVSAPAKIKKKTKAQKILDDFAIEDTKKVKKYLWGSVIKPAIKNIIWEFFTKGLKMYLFRDGEGPSTPASVPAEVPRINYATMYRYTPAAPVYSPPRTPVSYGEVIVPTYAEADAAIRELRKLIAESGVATIGNLYETCRLPTQFPDFTYGWRDLSDVQIVTVDGGYLISLPRPYPI